MYLKVNFAVLGTEESSTGDVAKRAGNEFLFQMQALMNIELLNAYEVKRIVTCDPHSFNCLKNEYSNQSLNKLMEGYFQGSFKSMVSFFMKKNDVDMKDLESILKNINEENMES